MNTKLSAITSNEAGRIGKSLVVLLLSNTTADVAVDEYILKYVRAKRSLASNS